MLQFVGAIQTGSAVRSHCCSCNRCHTCLACCGWKDLRYPGCHSSTAAIARSIKEKPQILHALDSRSLAQEHEVPPPNCQTGGLRSPATALGIADCEKCLAHQPLDIDTPHLGGKTNQSADCRCAKLRTPGLRYACRPEDRFFNLLSCPTMLLENENV